MFALYSKSCEYAIHALIEIASAGGRGEKSRARDICRKSSIPEAYARKTFQALAQAGFLNAIPGPGGGYTLARDPRAVTILDIIRAVEGDYGFNRCVLGFAECGHKDPCALHTVWTGLKPKIIEALSSRTLYDLVSKKSASAGKQRRGKKK